MGPGLDQKNFEGASDYQVMFGPDICGYSTKRIHAIFNHNGGWPSTGLWQGYDAALLPSSNSPTSWRRGDVVEVAWAQWANHGGGYAYRLCPKVPGQLPSEECFQQHHMRFAQEFSVLQHVNGTRTNIPLVKVSEGTTPKGSEWVRNPIPSCATGGSPSGHGFADACTETEFPEPIPGLHGFGHKLNDPMHPYNIMDYVVVPDDLPDGQYFLSWRWDCEQTTQIWQNCADIVISGGSTPSPPPSPAPADSVFGGCYDSATAYGNFTIVQHGDALAGTLGQWTGSGRVSGNTLTWTWPANSPWPGTQSTTGQLWWTRLFHSPCEKASSRFMRIV